MVAKFATDFSFTAWAFFSMSNFVLLLLYGENANYSSCSPGAALSCLQDASGWSELI